MKTPITIRVPRTPKAKSSLSEANERGEQVIEPLLSRSVLSLRFYSPDRPNAPSDKTIDLADLVRPKPNSMPPIDEPEQPAETDVKFAGASSSHWPVQGKRAMALAADAATSTVAPPESKEAPAPPDK